MIKDKTLAIFLMVLFAASGTATLILSWTRPMPETERIMATIIGSAGLIWALTQMLWYRTAAKNSQTVPAEAKIQTRNKI